MNLRSSRLDVVVSGSWMASILESIGFKVRLPIPCPREILQWDACDLVFLEQLWDVSVGLYGRVVQ